jgi:hypothetical protein
MLGDTSLGEDCDDVRPSPLVTSIPDGRARSISIRSGGEGLPTLVMFRDSFGTALGDLLSRHFRKAVYVTSDLFDRDLIDRERPDVVIVEMVERALMSPAPSDPDFGLKMNLAAGKAANAR